MLISRKAQLCTFSHVENRRKGPTSRADPSRRVPGCENASRFNSRGVFARLLKLLRKYTDVIDVAIKSPLEMGHPLKPL